MSTHQNSSRFRLDELTLGQLIGMATPPGWRAKDFADWPPDLFALTSFLLESTGLYRFVVDPDPAIWPPDDWHMTLTQASKDWFTHLNRGDALRSKPLAKRYGILFSKTAAKIRTSTLQYDDHIEDRDTLRTIRSILWLHALADHSCGGYGLPLGALQSPRTARGKKTALRRGAREARYIANVHLAVCGTLSRLPKQFATVIPKMRTPQTGLTVRTLSHHLTSHETEVSIVWRCLPWTSVDEDSLNLLVIPFPLTFEATWFQPAPLGARTRPMGNDRFFSYSPRVQINPQAVVDLVKQAHREVGRIHIIVLPELALSPDELRHIKDALANCPGIARRDMPTILTGLRETRTSRAKNKRGQRRKRSRNSVVLSSFFAEKWYDFKQTKHHRWKLTPTQIEAYRLAGVLTGKKNWWEDLSIPRRKLTFLAPNDWLTLSPLICEDLVQMEPCASVIRGVGPTLLVAILLDGPQLAERWSGRYASVLADDPGTSVLSVTSLGMAERMRKTAGPPAKPKRTVALWKDAAQGTETVDLVPGALGVVVTAAVERNTEFTSDGRSDGGLASRIVFQHTHQLMSDSDLHQHDDSREEPGGVFSRFSGRFAKSADLEELTRLIYAIDAAIDSMPADWPALFSVARKGRFPRKHKSALSAIDDLLVNVHARMDERTARRVAREMRSRGHLGTANRRATQRAILQEQDDLDLALTIAEDVLNDAQRHVDRGGKKSGKGSKRKRQVKWWTRLVRSAEDMLADIGAQSRPRHESLDVHEVVRVWIAVAHLFLAGIQSRLAIRRRQGRLSVREERLMKRIDASLNQSYVERIVNPPGSA